MKMRIGKLSLLTAVAAVSISTGLQAADLRWDGDGVGADASDVAGSWDQTSLNWNDPAPANIAWVDGSNAIFGDLLNTVANAPVNTNLVNVSINSDIVVNDIYLNNASNGGSFTFDAPSFNSLTVNGNIIKNGNAGPNRFDLLGGPFVLGAGDHVIALRDSPGGELPEMAVNANISGAGGFILDNRLTTVGTKESWGTLTLTGINDYSGQTQVKYGRVVIFESAGLGNTTGNTVISEAGTVSVGGPGVVLTAPLNLNIAENITIQRSLYTGGDSTDAGAYAHYGNAFVSNNGVGTTTLTGTLTVDSTDARIGANSSTLIIANPIAVGTSVANPQLSIGGDFAGFIKLAANNTALATGGVKLAGGQLDVDNDGQIGGASAPLTFAGGVYHPIAGYATDFGSHVINATTFNGSINVDDGQVFNINQPLGQSATAVGSLSKRGTGTMNITSTVDLRGGQTFWDGGIVNVSSDVKLHSLHLRSPIVNIGSGGVVTTSVGYSAVGQDTTGTNGGPDISTVNLTGSGKLIATANVDFNLSDNNNTRGTLNLGDTAEFAAAGSVYLGKSNNTIGTLNQTGGTMNLTRNANFSFVLGDGRDNDAIKPKGYYNMSGGIANIAGEAYVGEGVAGYGEWNQSAGTVTIDDWFVVGREKGEGHVDISGGTLIKKGAAGQNTPIGEGDPAKDNTFIVRGTGTFDSQNGEVWVANNAGGSGKATFTLKENGTVLVNNFFVVGRGTGSVGVFNMEGGTFTKSGTTGTFAFGGGSGNGTFNQSGGVLTATNGVIAGLGTGVANISGGTSTFSGAALLIARDAGAATVGTLNISGTANVSANSGVTMGVNANNSATLNISGGKFLATSIAVGNATGTRVVNFTGGEFSPGNFNVGTGLTNTGTGRLSPGIAAVGANAITGTYTQGATAAMDLDLAGSTAGSFDTLSATGAATVAGELKLTLLGGYSPVSLTPHAVVTAASVSGVFNSISGVSIGSGRGLAVTYSPTAITVTATQLGDANVDGKVDFTDLLALAQSYNGTAPLTWAQGDFGGDALVGFNDLLALAQNYGFGALNAESMNFASDWALAQSMVPEPTSLTLLGLGALAIRRRRA